MLEKVLRLGSLSLRSIKDSDFPILYKWRNEQTFTSNLSSRDACTSYEEFVRELTNDFFYDRHLQLIIEIGENTIGTVYSYQYDIKDQYVFVSIYIDNPIKYRGAGAKAIILFCNHLFIELAIHKIYFDIYAYNTYVIQQLKRRASLEGVFKNQHLKKGKRYDVLRFALYQDMIQGLSKV